MPRGRLPRGWERRGREERLARKWRMRHEKTTESVARWSSTGDCWWQMNRHERGRKREREREEEGGRRSVREGKRERGRVSREGGGRSVREG